MRTMFDHFAKQMTQEALSGTGVLSSEHEISSEVQKIDLWYRPDPTKTVKRQSFGWLGRLAEEGPTLLEFFHKPPKLNEFRGCLLKPLLLGRPLEIAARAQKEVPVFPRLWFLSAGRPHSRIVDFDLKWMPGWPLGFYSGPPQSKVFWVVIHELPEIPETLRLRLMGASPPRYRQRRVITPQSSLAVVRSKDSA